MFSLKVKKVILIRHAKAVPLTEWGGDDFDRPLSPFGRQSARTLGQYLRIIGAYPDKILVSPALRTKETALILAERLRSSDLIEYVPSLYGLESKKTALQTYGDILINQSKEVNTICIVGHNPDLSFFCDYLSHESSPKMHTGSVAILTLGENESWSDVGEKKLGFIHYSTPRFFHFETVGDDYE